MEYLKRAEKTPATGEDDTREVVMRMLGEIESGGESRVREIAEELDGWTGDIIVSHEQIEAASASLSQRTKDDIRFSYEQVRRFAEAQMASTQEFQTELHPGVIAGQRLIPVNTGGCYIPGGRYAHIASAVMSVTTAKVAGVPNVVACSPPHRGGGVHPAILYTANMAGADTILALGGVQGSRRWLLACSVIHRQICWSVRAIGLSLKLSEFCSVALASICSRAPPRSPSLPTDSADPEIVASDLVGQAEHGPDSPAWLVTTSRALAEKVMERVPHYVERLGEPNRTAAENAWRDYGEVVLADTLEEAVKSA